MPGLFAFCGRSTATKCGKGRHEMKHAIYSGQACPARIHRHPTLSKLTGCLAMFLHLV